MICLAVVLTFELQCWVKASISHIKGSLDKFKQTTYYYYYLFLGQM